MKEGGSDYRGDRELSSKAMQEKIDERLTDVSSIQQERDELIFENRKTGN